MAKNLLIMATEYKTLKAKETALKAELEKLKSEMIEIMAGAEKVTCGQYVIQNQVITSSVIDTKRLKAEHPDIAKDYTEEKESTRFTVR